MIFFLFYNVLCSVLLDLMKKKDEVIVRGGLLGSIDSAKALVGSESHTLWLMVFS